MLQIFQTDYDKLEMVFSYGFIQYPEQFYHIVYTIDELISVIYPSISNNITKNNQWLGGVIVLF